MRLDDILEKVRTYAPNADLDVVVRAYFYAARAHTGQTRKSGEEYFIHPVAVAMELAQLQLDVDSIATALLHDTVEDCLTTKEDIAADFGEDIAELVDGVTKIGKLQFRNKAEAEAENFRKLVLAMAKDIRVILVKLADRLHNMRTMEHMKPERQRGIAQETLDIYAPIANRLGLSKIKMELEDLCFRYLHPEIYEDLQAKVEAGEPDRQAYIEQVSGLLREKLAEWQVPATVSGRSKHLFSFYRKMTASHLDYEQVHDLLAFRVIVDALPQCYTALGLMHGLFRPVPDRFKDYIATPKSNGYQSLHTVVIGPEGRQVEIQIRTAAMHRVAEIGIAAHWKYKEGHLALGKDDIGKIIKLRELFEAAVEVDDPAEFLETVKVDLFANEIFAFTPRGDVKFFPQGATALDFAYAIHSKVGDRCAGAKVNGRLVPLSTPLSNGDTIEILTNADQKPSRDWLEMARTGRALNRIRRSVREEERERSRALGREMLESALKKFDYTIAKVQAQKTVRLDEALKKHGVRNLDQLVLAVGVGHLTADKVVPDMLPEGTVPEEEQKDTLFGSILSRFRKRPTASTSPVLVLGEQDLMVSYARCCNPLPGEPVAGFITRGHGITVHLATCPQLLASEAERRISVEWQAGAKAQHPCELLVVCANKPGMLADISAACKTLHVNINRISVEHLEDNKTAINLEVMIEDVKQLGSLMRSMERLKGVVRVSRRRASGNIDEAAK